MSALIDHNPLIEQLSQKLGIDGEQALGAVGLVLNALRNRLDDDDFSQLQQAIPEAERMMNQAPQAEGGLMAMAASWLGKDSIGEMAKLVEGLQSLGLDMRDLPALADTLADFLSEQGAGAVVDRIKDLISG